MCRQDDRCRSFVNEQCFPEVGKVKTAFDVSSRRASKLATKLETEAQISVQQFNNKELPTSMLNYCCLHK